MARLYELPRIHKKDGPLSPIVDFNNTLIYNLAKWMSIALKQLTNTAPTTVKAATDFFVKYKI